MRWICTSPASRTARTSTRLSMMGCNLPMTGLLPRTVDQFFAGGMPEERDLPFLGAGVGVLCRTAFPGRQETARRDGLERPSYTQRRESPSKEPNSRGALRPCDNLYFCRPGAPSCQSAAEDACFHFGQGCNTMAIDARIDTPHRAGSGKVTSEILDRLPPQNLDVEKGVLASILLDPQM